MGIPRTYLYCVPDADDPLGRCIQANDLYIGLRKMNRNIYMWRAMKEHEWWPGKDTGTICLWVGDPGGTSQKITAFNWGPIPELTQMGPDGSITIKGWRAIFDKIIRMGLISRPRIERYFGVNLSNDENSPFCERCLRSGKTNRTGGKPCTFHAPKPELAKERILSVIESR